MTEKLEGLSMEVEDLNRDITKLKKENKKLEEDKTNEVSSLEEKLKTLQNEIEESKSEAEAATQKASDIQSEFQEYKSKYRASVRKSLKGKKIDELVLLTGKRYKSATVTGVDAGGFLISFDGGLAKVKYADLPPNKQEMYGYDPVFATAFETEKNQKLASLQSLQRADAKIAAQNEANRKKLAATQKAFEDQQNKSARIATLTTQIANARTRISAIDSEISTRTSKQAWARIQGHTASHTAEISNLKREQEGLRRAINQAEGIISGLR